MAKYEPSKRMPRQAASSVAVTVVRTVPNQCPECLWAVQEAERKEKELLAKNEAALVAHKEHGKFLKTQLAKSAGDPALNEVFKKLFEDCVLLQAEKVVDILLAQDEEFGKQDFDRLRMIEAAAENFKIMQIATEIQFKQKEVQLGPTSEETKRLLDKLYSWKGLNDAISRLPNADDVCKTSVVQEDAGRYWKVAVRLAKGIELSR
jgi:hypothetical protein